MAYGKVEGWQCRHWTDRRLLSRSTYDQQVEQVAVLASQIRYPAPSLLLLGPTEQAWILFCCA